ncbi:MAG: hypothetical protein GX595_14380, partial [Lentisphaerae bacterium]|nr:hypothetical protein [Lentisphaerota bacterium]
HGNDWNAIAASYAGLYFSRYYPDLEIGQKLLRNIEALNAPNMAFWKVNEDCPGYGNITLTGNCDWALARPVPSYFQDGHLRQMVDFDMLITDNQGRASGIGDFSGFSTYQVDSYLLAAWLYKDGRYLWWWDRFIGRPARFWVPPEVLARQVPEDLVGIRRAPLDNWLYQSREPGRQGAIPQDRCFDKVSFRSGLEPADQYLCLSGLSYGFHAHADANAIVRYADQGRVCLYDDGYMIPTLSEHNTVIILKDGWAGRTPDFSEVTAEAESDRTGLFESRLDAYNGVAWDRAVIWSKGRHFLVIDDLRALEASRYSFQCLWRALGRTRLEGRRWTSEKDGSRFSLLVASDAALSLRESAGTSLNSPPFPLHEARALVQSSAHDLAVGQSAHFANLFYTEWTEAAPRPVEVARAGAGATTWFVRDGDEVAAAGIHACQGVDGVGIDADVFHLTAGHLLAAGLRSFSLGEMSLTATGAVSLDLDLATGTARLRCDGPATLTGPGAAPRRDLAAGESALALAPWPAAATAALAGALSKALQDATAADTAAAPAAAGSGDGLRQLWRYADFKVLAPASSLPGTRLHSTIQPLPKEEVGHGTGRVEDLLQSGANIMFRPGEAVVLTIDFPEARPVHEVVIASRQLRTFQGGCGLRRVVVSGSSDGFKQDLRRLAEVSHDKAPEDGLVDYPAGLEGKPAVSSLRLEIEPWSP